MFLFVVRLIVTVYLRGWRFNSDIVAGVLLFFMLWIPGSMSLYKSKTPKVAQNISLSSTFSGDYVHFNISANNFSDIKKFLFRISPYNLFHSTGFSPQINSTNNLPYPKILTFSTGQIFFATHATLYRVCAL